MGSQANERVHSDRVKKEVASGCTAALARTDRPAGNERNKGNPNQEVQEEGPGCVVGDAQIRDRQHMVDDVFSPYCCCSDCSG